MGYIMIMSLQYLHKIILVMWAFVLGFKGGQGRMLLRNSKLVFLLLHSPNRPELYKLTTVVTI